MPEEPQLPDKSKAIVAFLVRVSREPALRAAYAKDANAAMEEAGISQEQRDLILGGDLEAIKQELGTDAVSRIVWQPPTIWQ